MWGIVFTFFCLVTLSLAINTDKDEIESSLQRGLNEYINTGSKSEELTETLKLLQFPGLFRKDHKKGPITDLICLTCNVGIGALIKARRLGASRDLLVDISVKLCVWLNLEPEYICHKMVNGHADTLIFIIDNSLNVTSKRACSIILQGEGCIDPDREDWTIEIPPRVDVQRKPRDPSGATPLKVLQITDIHYDPDYTIGTNAVCEDFICCQPGTVPAKPEDAAGKWGDYRGCDMSLEIINTSLSHIVGAHDIDYFYYTGDIVDHNAWETSTERNSEIIKTILDLFKVYFDSIPVYPILGNHEPHPVNAFSSDDANNTQISTQWIFDLVAEEWKDWLPADTRATILKGGYYTVLVKPGFRIVALNSNVCFTLNWWLMYDDVDPFDQLKWLVQVLLEAEGNNELVHIISHVPSGDDDCLQNYGKEFTRIVERFSDIIVAQFNGHSHKDENVIYFNSSNPDQAINVAFNGASLTPYRNVNPNYVIYDVDPETYEVLDYKMYIYNITNANERPDLEPIWYQLYSFKEAYGVENMTPSEMGKLAERIAENRTLTEQYFRFKYRESDTKLAKGCDDDCHLENLCYMVTPYYGHTHHCERLAEIFKNSANSNV